MRLSAALLGSVVVDAVDRNNFKKCSDSSFCQRRRVFNSDGVSPYSVTKSELIENDSILQLTLEVDGRPCLKALHSILPVGARINIEECEPLHVSSINPAGNVTN